MMRRVVRLASQLQHSQVSVQALTRFGSVYLFLLASWTDRGHLPLVALQGVLLAIPYTLLEAMIGRALSAEVVPGTWDVEVLARRAALAMAVPVGVVGYLSASVALPGTSQLDRLVMTAPVVLQLPLEGLFWATARTRSRPRANLIPQLTAVGLIVSGAVFAGSGIRMDAAALPGQLLVLAWALSQRRSGSSPVRPTVWQSVRVGSAYSIAAVIDLVYSVALPSIAGRLVGESGLVVLRAMDLAFGPVHVLLSATVREDIVVGRGSRLLTGARVLTIGALAVVSTAVLVSPELRRLLAADLAATGTAAVALYCGYKTFLVLSTWLSTRHMIRAESGRYLVSAIGSRVIAFGSLAVAFAWVTSVQSLFLQLLACEIVVVGWFSARIATTAADYPVCASDARSAVASRRTAS